MSVTQEEIRSAVRRRWPRMTEVDLRRVMEAIDTHVAEQGSELDRVESSATYVAVWANRSGEHMLRHHSREEHVLAYVHLGFVALPKEVPGTGWNVVKLSSFEDGTRVTLPEEDRGRCVECNLLLPVSGVCQCQE